ncbi:MAG: biotin/lipoyl-binding protein [Rhodothermales bacterium]|nr:biotin/lipoyl-binding protein [Rhodothermales bacterium]
MTESASEHLDGQPVRPAPYLVRIGDREIRVDPDELGDDVRLDHISGRRFLLHVNGRIVPLVIEPGEGHSVAVTTGHRRFDVDVLDERAQLLSSLGVQGPGAGVASDLKAPMPGLVLDVRVQTGDRIAAGDSLLVLEAMKMENELRAESDAVVEEVSVSSGEAVTKGQVLIRFGDGESG